MAFPVVGKLAVPPWLLPGLPARAAWLLAYTALLRPRAGGTQVALALVALLLWLQWDYYYYYCYHYYTSITIITTTIATVNDNNKY